MRILVLTFVAIAGGLAACGGGGPSPRQDLSYCAAASVWAEEAAPRHAPIRAIPATDPTLVSEGPPRQVRCAATFGAAGDIGTIELQEVCDRAYAPECTHLVEVALDGRRLWPASTSAGGRHRRAGHARR